MFKLLIGISLVFLGVLATESIEEQRSVNLIDSEIAELQNLITLYK